MGGNSIKPGVLEADPAIIAREAKRVAAMAAKELKEAGEAAKSVPVGTPTWTGTVGVAGRPGVANANASPYARGGFGAGRGGRGGGGRGGSALPSSSAVLANLSARQGISTPQRLSSPATGSSRGVTPQAQQQQAQGKDFMKLIRDYLVAHGGAVYTQMLIDHFNRYCGSPERTAEFKEMLRVIAVLDKGDGRAEVTGRGGRGTRGSRGTRQVQPGGAASGRGKWVLRKEYGGTA